LAANALAYLLTEVRRPLLPFKPFTCWGCLAFWLTTLIGVVLAFQLAPTYRHPETQTVAAYGFAGASVLLGLVNYLWVKSKYQVYE